MLSLLRVPVSPRPRQPVSRRVSLRKERSIRECSVQALAGVRCDGSPLCWQEALFWTLRKGCTGRDRSWCFCFFASVYLPHSYFLYVYIERNTSHVLSTRQPATATGDLTPAAATRRGSAGRGQAASRVKAALTQLSSSAASPLLLLSLLLFFFPNLISSEAARRQDFPPPSPVRPRRTPPHRAVPDGLVPSAQGGP